MRRTPTGCFLFVCALVGVRMGWEDVPLEYACGDNSGSNNTSPAASFFSFPLVSDCSCVSSSENAEEVTLTADHGRVKDALSTVYS